MFFIAIHPIGVEVFWSWPNWWKNWQTNSKILFIHHWQVWYYTMNIKTQNNLGIASCYHLVKTDLIPLTTEWFLWVQHSVGNVGLLLQLARISCFASGYIHSSDVSCFLLPLSCGNTSWILSFFKLGITLLWQPPVLLFFFPQQRVTLKLIFTIGLDSEGKFGREEWVFFLNHVYLEALVKNHNMCPMGHISLLTY